MGNGLVGATVTASGMVVAVAGMVGLVATDSRVGLVVAGIVISTDKRFIPVAKLTLYGMKCAF